MRIVDCHGSTGALTIARWCLGLLLLWIGLVQDLQAVCDLPPWWFDRIGLVGLVPEGAARAMLNPALLSTLKWLGCALAIAFAAGARPLPLIAWGLALVATLAQCLGPKAFSGGFATHHESAAILAVAVFAACQTRASRTAADPEARARTTMTLCALTVAIPYMAVGVHRLVHGGTAIFLGDSIVAWQVSHSLQYSETGFTLGLHAAQSPGLAAASKLGFFLATLAETVAPLCLIMGTRWRIAWLSALVAMHAGSALMMNVHFWENLVLLLVFCSGLPQWIAARRGVPSPPRLTHVTTPR